jgi:hypothetical protein
LWDANTADGKAAIINANLLLQSGTSGTYTGHFRENVNSSGGTRFNGQITQGAGENWTMRFSQFSSRGSFTLNNAANSFSGLYNQNTTVLSSIAGSFGGAAITLGGGTTGTQTNEHYSGADAVSNTVTLAANAIWNSGIATRLSGSLTQSTFALTYAGGSLSRASYSSVSGTGITTIRSGALWVDDMTKLSSGTLNLGDGTNAGFGSFVLSGSGVNAPTWSTFSSSRAFNQAGGSGTWRINNTTTAAVAGGFAAMDADVTIPHQTDPSAGGITDTTFARNFTLGSTATQGGNRVADYAVKINTDIAFGTAEYRPAISWNTQTVAGSASTSWTLGGPVHELNGVLSGANIEIVPLSNSSSTNRGIVRITNASNSLTGASVWVLGSTRSTWTTPGGISIAGSNPDDLSGAVAIFTNDGAFGGSNVEVVVSALGSSGTATNSLLLFQDVPGTGTTFDKNFSILNNTDTYSAGFGSWSGAVTYTGDISMPATLGTKGAVAIHVRQDTMTLGTGGNQATLANNRSAATTYYKEGAGTLDVRNFAFSGTQATNNWNVRGGTLLVNQALPTGNVTVANGGTLGGTGSITGNVTVQSGGTYAPGNSPGLLSITGNLVLQNGSQSVFEIDSDVRGTGYDATDVTGNLTYDGTLTLDFGSVFANDTYSFNLFDWTGTLSGSFDAVNLAGSYSGILVNTAGVWTHSDLDGNEWTFTQADGVLAFTAIPEPGVLVLLGVGVLLLRFGLRRRR